MRPLTINREELKRFADLWWVDFEGYVEIRPIAHHRDYERAAFAARLFVPASESAADRVIEHLSQHAHLHPHVGWYAGVCPRVKASGTAADVTHIPGAWLDLDDHGSPERLSDGLERLKLFTSMGCTPTLIVQSGGGGGKHIYFRYPEPLDRDEGVALNRRLARLLCADAAATDAARVLRIPGTWHTKGDPVLCEIVESSHCVIHPADFIEAIETLEARFGLDTEPEPIRAWNITTEGWLPLSREEAERMTEVCARFRRMADVSQPDRVTEPEWGRLAANLRAVLPDDPSLWLSWCQVDGQKEGSTYDEKKALEYYTDRHFRAPVHCQDIEAAAPRLECRACPFFAENRTPAFLLRRHVGQGRLLGAPSAVDQIRQGENIDETVVRRALQYEREALNTLLAEWIEAGETEKAAQVGRWIERCEEGESVPQHEHTAEESSDSPGEETVDEDTIVRVLQDVEQQLSSGHVGTGVLDRAIAHLAQLTQKSEIAAAYWMKRLTKSDPTLSLKDLQRFVRAYGAKMEQAATVLAAGGEGISVAAQTVSRRGREPRVHLVGEFCPGAPDPWLVCPDGYIVSSDGVYKVTEDEERLIISTPIYVSARLEPMEPTSEAAFELTACDGFSWFTLTLPRGDLSDTRKILKLSAYHLGVTSTNASKVIDFLNEFERANRHRLERKGIASRMGWFRDGFLLGENFFDTGSAGRKVSFAPEGGGDEQLCQALTAAGDVREWQRLLAPAMGYPVIRVLFDAAFVPPLLDMLECPNFVIDLSGRTSRGKTTALKVAASVAGVPRRDGGGLLRTWNQTQVSLERLCTASCHIPVFLDDTKDALNENALGKLVYLLAGGQGKGRGQVRGAAVTAHWRTVVFSTGESSILTYSKDGGTRGRVLNLHTLPFGEASPRTAQLVQQLQEGLQRHYGHAYPLFLRYICAHRSDWETWRMRARELQASYESLVEDPVAKRLAQYVAAIQTAGEVAHAAFVEAGCPLPWEMLPVDFDLFAQATEAAEDPIREVDALEAALELATSNPHRFYGRMEGRENGEPPTGGWLGQWKAGDFWDYIAFLPNALEKFMKERGFQFEEIVEAWWERGWLEGQVSRRGGKEIYRQRKQVKIAGNPVFCICLKKSAVENATETKIEPNLAVCADEAGR
ncbi:Uncharcterized protein, DUF927 family [Alicyclobacillus tolerans]|uniref:Uncharcterized protein, DUF927 family n=1 Tax=Alicyclobacillus tolerans TaxID=90970 RepID=A0A1M6X3V0_9BACL|nr:DUF927 domain-containing protein [Alicyclobacillus montanus]SHL00475.1 Uncharcterized protein, DUF927 family [Alicyclobacillus montanus]